MRLCIFEFYADPCGAERGEIGGGDGGILVGERGDSVWGRSWWAMICIGTFHVSLLRRE